MALRPNENWFRCLNWPISCDRYSSKFFTMVCLKDCMWKISYAVFENLLLIFGNWFLPDFFYVGPPKEDIFRSPSTVYISHLTQYITYFLLGLWGQLHVCKLWSELHLLMWRMHSFCLHMPTWFTACIYYHI